MIHRTTSLVRQAVKRYTVLLEFLIVPRILLGCVQSVSTAGVCEAPLRSALWVWVWPFRGTGERDETAPLQRNQLQATQTPKNAQSPTTPARRSLPRIGCIIAVIAQEAVLGGAAIKQDRDDQKQMILSITDIYTF
jgi:hypothetical protein